MKATGVVRRIDELGRLVIPKEIRKNFKIREGDSIEFFVEGNRIFLEKYSLLSGILDDITQICTTLQEAIDNTVLYVYEDDIVTGYGKKYDDFMYQPISRNIRYYINERNPQRFKDSAINLNGYQNYSGYVSPVLVNSDLLGAFIILNDERAINERDIELIHIVTKLVSRVQEL